MNGTMQYSICKIDKELVCQYYDQVTKETPTEDMLEIIIENLCKQIRKKDEVEVAKKDGFVCLFITLIRTPEWKEPISYIMDYTDESQKIITNTSASFIMFMIADDEIYATSGGYANYLLNSIKEKNYGRDLIPKITKDSENIIKSITSDNIGGRKAASTTTMKNTTSVYQETESDTIPRSFQLILGQDIFDCFGLEPEDNSKKVGLDGGDQIKLKKGLTLLELKSLIQSLPQIEKLEDNYYLGYLVPIRKIERKTTIEDQLYTEMVLDMKILEIQPKVTEEYCNNTIKYILEYGDQKEEYREPIKMEDVEEFIEKKITKKLSKSFLNVFFKNCQISCFDETEKITHSSSLYYTLRGSIEYDGRSFYLLDGTWLTYEKNKYDIIKKEYEELYDYIERKINELNLKNKFELIITSPKTEEEYNESFCKNQNILSTHPKRLKNVEIADLIFWDENNLYLMCNKRHLDAKGARDVLCQIDVSSCIVNGIIHNKDNNKLIKEYYESLKDTEKEKISLANFISLFEKRIYYIAGFSDNFKKDLTSVHCQNLMKEISRKLFEKNMDFLALNYLEENSK